MPASIEHKVVGSQEVSEPSKVQTVLIYSSLKMGLSCRTGKIHFPIIKKGTCPHLAARPELVCPRLVLDVQMCLYPCEKGRSGFLQVMHDQWKTTQITFLQDHCDPQCPLFCLWILVVTNWIHLSRWCSFNYPGSKFPWTVTSEELFTPVKHIQSVTFPLVTPGLVLIFALAAFTLLSNTLNSAVALHA